MLWVENGSRKVRVWVTEDEANLCEWLGAAIVLDVLERRKLLSNLVGDEDPRQVAERLNFTVMNEV